MLVEADYSIVYKDGLPTDGNTYEFEGKQYLGAEVSFI